MFGNDMEYRAASGDVLHINPFNQPSIDAAKRSCPGEGVGPFVASAISDAIACGYVTRVSSLPPEYRFLGEFANLPE